MMSKNRKSRHLFEKFKFILSRDICSCPCPGTTGHRDKKFFLSRDKGTRGRPVPFCPGMSRGTSRPLETLLYRLFLFVAIYCKSERETDKFNYSNHQTSHVTQVVSKFVRFSLWFTLFISLQLNCDKYVDNYEPKNNLAILNQNLIGLIVPIKDTNFKVFLVNHI